MDFDALIAGEYLDPEEVLEWVERWTDAELREWLKVRCLGTKGNQKELKDRVEIYWGLDELRLMSDDELRGWLRSRGNSDQIRDMPRDECIDFIQDLISEWRVDPDDFETEINLWPTEELRNFCRRRRLYAGGIRIELESRVVKHAGVPDFTDPKTTVAELKECLRELDLRVSGRKRELEDRILEFYAQLDDDESEEEDGDGEEDDGDIPDEGEYGEDSEGYEDEDGPYDSEDNIADNLANLNLGSKKSEPAGRRHTIKKAVVVGVSYRGTNNELNGTINDAGRVCKLLVEEFEFDEDNIRLLTDAKGTSADMLPKRSNIQTALNWLVKDQKKGDSLFFYFAGHGGEVEDDTGRERDSTHQTICPMDSMQITDKELNKWIVRPLKQGVTLHALMDSCHSGTVLNLAYNAKLTKGTFTANDGWEEEYTAAQRDRVRTKGGHAYQFSAARRDESALETIKGGESVGAATYAFCKAILAFRGRYGEVSYGNLLSTMYDALKGSREYPGQEPTFSSNDEFNMDDVTFEFD